jgi:hypothetical protein
MGLPGAVSGIFGDAVGGLMNGLGPILCGDGSSTSQTLIDTTEMAYDCASCQTATKSHWTGTQIITAADGSKQSIPGQTCTMNGFASYACNNPTYDGTVNCENGQFKHLTLVNCAVKKKKPADLGGSTDKPLPLDLTDDWTQHQQIRAFTMLTDTQVAARRQSVNVATKNKGSSPAFNQMLGMAQAEFYPLNGYGYADATTGLWHMDWRARLVRFRFGGGNGNDVGDAGNQGVPANAAGIIGNQLQSFLQNDSAAALADQFLLH